MSCGRDTRRQHPSPVSGLPSPWPGPAPECSQTSCVGTHSCGGKPPWSCPESGMRSLQSCSGRVQPCRPGCIPFTCLEGTGDLAASPLTHRALGTPGCQERWGGVGWGGVGWSPTLQGLKAVSTLARSHASISRALSAPQEIGSWWTGVCGLICPLSYRSSSLACTAAIPQSPLTADLPGKASLPGCSSLS